MALSTRRPLHAPTVRGFSLIELSVVVAIISVVATLGLEVAANFVSRTATSVSRERLKVVDEATAAFFRVYGRLPCPAVISDAPTAATYGLESCGITVLTGTTIGGGLMAGAVPFRTLNLPAIYGLDGFNSKFNYVVTKNLTNAGTGATQFGNAANVPGIEMRTGRLAQPCNSSNCQVLADASTNNGAAYVIFSSGADQRGAVSARGVSLKSCTASNTANSERRVDAQNCVFGNATTRGYLSVYNGSTWVASTIPYNVFYDNRVNAGLNLTSYFDDVVVWRPRSQL